MKHLLPLALLQLSFSAALADTPGKIKEDYRKAAAADLAKVAPPSAAFFRFEATKTAFQGDNTAAFPVLLTVN